MKTTLLVLAMLAALAGADGADADAAGGAAGAGVGAPKDFHLLHTCPCDVGGAGTPEYRDWRIQLGVFADRDRAEAFAADLSARRIAADAFRAGWVEGWVVVSSPRSSRAAALEAAKQYRTTVAGAMVRRYVHCAD